MQWESLKLKAKMSIEAFCKNSDLCASRQGPARKIRASLSQYNIGAPMERLVIDILGPLPQSKQGNKYILITADYFTKWVEAYPLVNQEAVTGAELLIREFISIFEVPLILYSDQGRNFESAVSSEMCFQRCASCKSLNQDHSHPPTV